MSAQPCDSYCEHGGVCMLDAGHDGLHDSHYCQWDDAHALTKKAADDILIRERGTTGAVIAAVEGALREAVKP